MSKTPYGYVLFYTSAAAFRAEKLAALATIGGARLVPTPRELSSDCGVALRFAAESLADTERMLAEHKVAHERIVAGTASPGS
jgi:hypothetical protein